MHSKANSRTGALFLPAPLSKFQEHLASAHALFHALFSFCCRPRRGGGCKHAQPRAQQANISAQTAGTILTLPGQARAISPELLLFPVAKQPLHAPPPSPPPPAASAWAPTKADMRSLRFAS